ncbi:hypothetical protein PENSTE_c009G02648 [Penicillium steckii]|uniref:Uncharacterized protein n=1 Tax=Penicillium steckii TaxID=303698 RepID=A0A1V6TAR0_9EURO|nr:hypothetical protein PENSTE_c009G02648 [Penicillium steckii]
MKLFSVIAITLMVAVAQADSQNCAAAGSACGAIQCCNNRPCAYDMTTHLQICK